MALILDAKCPDNELSCARMYAKRPVASGCGLLLLVFSGLSAACAPIRGAPSHVRRLAERDLRCPAEQMSYAKAGVDTYDARGCNRQVRYVRACRRGTCEWRQDAPPQTVTAPPR